MIITYQKLEYKPSLASIGAIIGRFSSINIFNVSADVRNVSASKN